MMIFKKKKVEIDVLELELIMYIIASIKNREVARLSYVLENEETLFICDILHTRKNRDYNKGYGSMMMEKLIEYAKEHNYTHIYGNLSTVDWEHKDRLHHFYEKFGFKITEYPKVENCYYGRIDLYLNNQE